MKKYKVIFFDWDGTAVLDRNEVPEQLFNVLIKLLENGVKLIIISGTTYNNIAYGKLHELFPNECLDNLFMGLGRGAYNYGFKDGIHLICDNTPTKAQKILLDNVCYNVHKNLYENFDIVTDITFSRPNYCKVDLMPNHNRNNQFYMNTNEINMLNNMLREHKFEGEINELIDYSIQIGIELGLKTKITSDAKYLEIGFTTKSDNVDFFMKYLDLDINDCVFFGDEFSSIAPGIPGSDAYMITDLTKSAKFFDVNNNPHIIPENVTSLKGATETFYEFLCEQLAKC